MSDINDVLASVTRIHGDLLISRHLNNEVGPNSWDDVGPGDFGPQHDFDTENHGSIIVLDCYSNAALQWCYRYLPQDCPRWGAQGFAIEANYVADILVAMEVEGLMSREAFDRAEYENHMLQLQEKIMAFEVRIRDWWKRNPSWPGGREPAGLGNWNKSRKLGTFESEDEARDCCREYNNSHDPGFLSRKAEFKELR